MKDPFASGLLKPAYFWLSVSTIFIALDLAHVVRNI